MTCNNACTPYDLAMELLTEYGFDGISAQTQAAV